MQELKKTLIESINRDRQRQKSMILLPWHAQKLNKTPKDLYATLLLKDGRRATVSAKRQRDILEAYKDDAVMVLECQCSW